MASSERIFRLLDTPVVISVRRCVRCAGATAGAPAVGAQSRDARRPRRTSAAPAHRLRTRLVRVQRRGLGAARRVVHRRAGRAHRHRRGDRRRQDDDHQSAAAVLRRQPRAHHGRRRRHPRAAARASCGACSGWCCRTCTCSPARSPPTCGWATSDDQRRRGPARADGGARRRFVDALGGLEPPVVERGATLSVGQKQLLSFARALAFDPPVLVLDEATSSIDTETEMLIRDALRRADARPHDAWRSRIACRRSRTWIAFWCFTRASCASRARTRSSSRERGIYYRLYELQYAVAPDRLTTEREPAVGEAP